MRRGLDLQGCRSSAPASRRAHHLVRPRPRPHLAAPHLVVLAAGPSIGARQRRLHLPPMTPGRLRWLAPRRPLRDNPVLILLWIGLLVAALAAMLSLAARSSQLSLDFLSSVVLYAVSVADLTLMLALVFVLARNVLKLVVERRRALPFARFRAKLVAALLGLTLIPAVLVLLVGSEIIRNAAQRWFSPPIDTVISSARGSRATTTRSGRAPSPTRRQLARALSTVDLASGDLDDPQHPRGRARTAAVEPGRGLPRHRARRRRSRPSSGRGAEPAARLRAGLRARLTHGVRRAELVVGAPAVGGELLRDSAPIRPSPDAPPTGVVIASST